MSEEEKNLDVIEEEIAEEEVYEIPESFVVKTELKTEEEIEREIKLKTSKAINIPTLGKRVIAAGTDFLFAVAMLFIAIIFVIPSITLPINEPHWMDVFTSQLSSGLFVLREGQPDEENIISEEIFGVTVYFGPRYDDDENVIGYWNLSEHGQQADIDRGYTYFTDAMVSQTFAFFSEYLAQVIPSEGSRIIPEHFGKPDSNNNYTYSAVAPPSDFDLFSQKYAKEQLVDEAYPIKDTYSEMFTAEWFNYRFLGLPNRDGKMYGGLVAKDYFKYQTNPDDPSEIYYDKLAVTNEKYTTKDNDNNPIIRESDRETLYEYCRQKVTNTGVALFAEFDFYKAPFTKINNTDFVAAFIAYVIVMLIFYFMFPMIFKSGETLGKKMFGLGILTKDGYEIKKIQSAVRFLAFFTEMTLGIASIGLGMVAWILVTAFSKKNRSVHDMIAGTIVILKAESVWYKNKEDEDKYNELIRSEVEKLRQIDPNEGNPNREYID